MASTSTGTSTSNTPKHEHTTTCGAHSSARRSRNDRRDGVPFTLTMAVPSPAEAVTCAAFVGVLPRGAGEAVASF
eukprot:scaffold1720_cov238-Pinguiococcus_pyrenoidosus.AAC.3